MEGPKNQYHFQTVWHLDATAEEVFAILDDVYTLCEWWPSVYLDLRVLDEGDSKGIGKVVELYTKGFLPYTLRWKFRSTEKDPPHHIALQAFGDLTGTGVWTIRKQTNGQCKVIYDWSIEAEKPLLKYLSFLFKPLFSANHHWAMRKGEESIQLELLRRRAATEEERNSIPAPPGPTFPHNRTRNKVF